uniref:Uncharacterized protein n=1 Tax=Magallana gigas TaxID=29159 RepID=A0A8W8JCJ1_MAGGI
MEKWFVISALVLLMDFTTLVINGAFHRAFKDFKETPKASDFIQEDANELKAPVLAFVVQETITEIKSIAVTIYLFYNSRSLRSILISLKIGLSQDHEQMVGKPFRKDDKMVFCK